MNANEGEGSKYTDSVLSINEDNEIVINYTNFRDPFTVIIRAQTEFMLPVFREVHVTFERLYSKEKGLCKNDGAARRVSTTKKNLGDCQTFCDAATSNPTNSYSCVAF